MSATRSECCKKAMRKIVSGETDGYWTYEHWDDFYHTACEMLHKEIVEADMGYFIKTTTLTHAGSGLFALPSDFYALKWLSDASGPLYSVEDLEAEESLRAGFTIEGDNIRIVNFTAVPDTIELRYVCTTKEITPWTSAMSDDPDTTDYKQESPLNSKKAERVISEIMMALAKVRDESMTPETASTVEEMISNFVDRLGTRIQNEPDILGFNSY